METDESANNVPPLRDELPVVQSDVTYAGVQQQYVGAAEAVAEHCKRYLTREWKHSRTPKGYSAAWKELWGQSSTTSTATTFYTTAGYQAWLGLFLAVYSSRESRSFRTKKLADLEGFPVEVKRWIALELTRTQPDPTVEKAMRNLQARYPGDCP
ncbi:hypothetical protein BFJ63_vAg18711 [Fusarium oxysporum f. sp. narcissi]|uniref:Uncharacterized protein n=1 Tax=Fusarium oxysporum f. sp. narcissi TaxID=451672 RepID=A0A4V1RXK4_FUSOX|nr:hypothetical protein BFJ63_vAg18711 [Fusarium oxysporum f. sp. narcissi]